MRSNNSCQGIDSNEVIDDPIPWECIHASDHETGAGEAEDEGKLEALEETRHFFEEGDVFYFFGRRSPCHVNFEEMAKERLGDVEGDTTQEDSEKKKPFEVFEYYDVCKCCIR